MSMSSLLDQSDKPKSGVIPPIQRTAIPEVKDADGNVITPARPGMGNLTRAGMEAALAQGMSLILKRPDGTPYQVAKREDLPSEAVMAKGDAQAEAKARASIRAQIEALEAQEKSLAPAKGFVAADDPNEAARKKIAQETAAAAKK